MDDFWKREKNSSGEIVLTAREDYWAKTYAAVHVWVVVNEDGPFALSETRKKVAADLMRVDGFRDLMGPIRRIGETSLTWANARYEVVMQIWQDTIHLSLLMLIPGNEEDREWELRRAVDFLAARHPIRCKTSHDVMVPWIIGGDNKEYTGEEPPDQEIQMSDFWA